ncbi:DUF2178 domain-containing protein [Thermococcus peptonophilus]|uniref:DUF2178 domain-containing protein n=1 Tax=Thermococcus peptonophilus TaxID=53952 RepID=A0A142CU58_9EURY|nr:DUF2178 domain-containing protein [Thermococcus peptonophilus]AMQ18310.1 hypothetical protein A0127_03540 [Thermococcus peptonophilus]
MNEALESILLWAGIVLGAFLTLLILSKRSEDSERRKASIPAFLVVLTMGYFLGWTVSNDNLAAAFSVFMAGAILLHIYYRELEKRGYVLSDERTLRIEEAASRRTLQVTMLLLAALTVYFSVEKTMNPELEMAFKVVSGVLALVFVLHWALLQYYSRVM